LAILNLVSEMVKKDNSTLTYVCWPCGLGKSTSLLQWGSMLGLNCLPKRGNKTVAVCLVVANDLVTHYKQAFTEKQALADPRIIFEWLSMDDLKKKLKECPSAHSRGVLLVDEGDTMLVREIHQQLALSYPRHLVLISAVPREAWSGTQRLCFQDGKRRAGKYLDVKAVFPLRRNEDGDEPELLPESADEIVKLAVEKAKVQPVLFYGKSTVYSRLKDWPKDQRLTPVALSLSINAK
jgi:hypothetical protein